MDSERDPTGRTPIEGADDPGRAQDDDRTEAPEDAAGHDVEGEHAATGANSALPAKLEAWRRRSAAGAILTGFALGLQEALETRKDEPSIVMETSGDPPKDLPVEAEFEYGRPRQSVVQIRPWLLPEQAADDPGATERGAVAPNGAEQSSGAPTRHEPKTEPKTEPGHEPKTEATTGPGTDPGAEQPGKDDSAGAS